MPFKPFLCRTALLNWFCVARCRCEKAARGINPDGLLTELGMCSCCARTNARIGWSSGALGAIVKARVQYRHRALPALRRATEAHRGHRGCGRHRPHPHASGAGRAAATARAGETGGSVSGGVRCKTGPDFDRAGGGVRTALGQTLRGSGIQAR